VTSLVRSPLTIVWAFLTTITIASSFISLDGGAAHQINAVVTAAVLLIAAVKAYLVIQHFMEVRAAPLWLKLTTGGWVLGLFTLLLGFYFAGR
jgi:cytochrome c oxidase subunit IV